MTEQWQELKGTIIELRDNDGTGTQQEVCKFLANLMNVLEKQMQEPKTDIRDNQVKDELNRDKDEQKPCDDAISRQGAIKNVAQIAKAVAKSDKQKSLCGRIIFMLEHMSEVSE